MTATIGFYRLKTAAVLAAGNTVVISYNGTPVKTCNILPLSLCDGKKVIKYLNKDGEYRFYSFSKYYEEVETPKEIGKVNSIVSSILESKSNTRSVGYKSERILKLASEQIPTAHLNIIRDIYTSPRIYLYIGTTTDLESDWILVTVKAANGMRKEAKKQFTTMLLDVMLPETYTISML